MNFNSRILSFSYVLSAVTILGLITPYFTENMDYETFLPLIAGVSLSSVNHLIGLFLIKLGIAGGNQKFLILVMGGMVVRMFAMLLLILGGLFYLKLNSNLFIFSVFSFYFLLLSLEIVFLHTSKILKKNTVYEQSNS